MITCFFIFYRAVVCDCDSSQSFLSRFLCDFSGSRTLSEEYLEWMCRSYFIYLVSAFFTIWLLHILYPSIVIKSDNNCYIIVLSRFYF